MSTDEQKADVVAWGKRLRKVAAQLAAERVQGWANPLVGTLTDAADFLDPLAPLPNPPDVVTSTTITALQERIKELEGEVTKANRLAADRRYMMEAYHSMLGENGLKMAAIWTADRVHRVHYSWGPEASALTGEERAALMLGWENAPRTIITDVDAHLDALKDSGNGSEVAR